MEYCDGIDPDAATSWRRPRERLKCELRAIKMAPDEISSPQKWSIAIAGLFWMGWSGYLVVVRPELTYSLTFAYMFYTILLGYAFGRIHKIPMDEIRKFASEGVNVSIGRGDSSDSEDDNN